MQQSSVQRVERVEGGMQYFVTIILVATRATSYVPLHVHTVSSPKWCEGCDLSWILEQLPMTTAHPVEQYMCMIM